VTWVPATLLDFRARPDFLVADLNSTFSFAMELKNPLPVDGVISLEIPDTFQQVDPNPGSNSVLETDMDGTYTVEVVGPAGGFFTVLVRRAGDGTVVTQAAGLSFQINKVVNQAAIGNTGGYRMTTFLNDETTRVDVGDSHSIFIDKQVTNVGVGFGSSSLAVLGQPKKWFFHGYGLNALDEIKWVHNSASEDDHCQDGFVSKYGPHEAAGASPNSAGVSVGLVASGVADAATEFDVLFVQENSEANGPFKLCYKFHNETGPGLGGDFADSGSGVVPWKLYAGMEVEVREFYEIVAANEGALDEAVAHREKTLSARGFGVADGDQVRWIESGLNCSEQVASQVSYEDNEWWAGDAVACVATSNSADDGADANFYCVNGGTIRGTTGRCACVCAAGYEGWGCATASACVATSNAGDNGADGNYYCTGSGSVGGTTGGCTCACATGYEGAGCATASACVATTQAADVGTDGYFYCVNGGSIGGTTGGCTCACAAGYEGTGCGTASACVATSNAGDDGADGNYYCEGGGSVGGTTGGCTCACATGYEGAGCATASACVATTTSTDDGTDGNVYCINGGTATGTTGACGCTCAAGYEGAGCATSS
jgi:hypothetical protein